jgi:hypothetical protein
MLTALSFPALYSREGSWVVIPASNIFGILYPCRVWSPGLPEHYCLGTCQDQLYFHIR